MFRIPLLTLNYSLRSTLALVFPLFFPLMGVDQRTLVITMSRGIPKYWNLFIKNWVFILICLNFSHLQNTHHLMQYTYWDLWGWGMGVMPFLVKNYWTLRAVWASRLVNNPSWNGQMHWKSLQNKNSVKPNVASHNTTSWYTDTDGFLGHSHSRWSLY